MPSYIDILLFLLGVLAALILIAVINTIRIGLKKTRGEQRPAIEVTESELAHYADGLSRMVQVPTVSSPEDLTEFYRLHRCMEELFPLVHQNLEKIDLHGNLLFRWKGRDASLKPIVLMGHQDVVPASDDGWDYPAFSGQQADGRIYGRGSLDCKCTVYSEFQAVEELLAKGYQPDFDVYLAASTDEEISGTGAPDTVDYLKSKGVECALVMDEGGAIVENIFPGLERPLAVIGIMEKGYVDVTFTASGKGGHSSAPPRNTPLERISAFVTRVSRKKPFKKEFAPEVLEMFKKMAPHLIFPLRLVVGNMWLFKPLVKVVLPIASAQALAFISTTCAFTMCKGSDAPNVIPKEAHVTANLRVCDHQDADESLAVLNKIARKYDLRHTILEKRNASPKVDTKGMVYKQLEESIARCFPDLGVVPYILMGGTDCRFYTAISENAIRFSPIRMNQQQLNSTHGINENIFIKALGDSVKFYKYLIMNFRSEGRGNSVGNK
ncbi:MAG: M20/M25/M40 family metallo-hydrolase [Firmicutes bacterium]|nr:M20/M25/M40 family metallo-hydrolase [Bacillota bacterium]